MINHKKKMSFLDIDTHRSPMSNFRYIPLARNDEEQKPLESNPGPYSGDKICAGRGILGLLLILAVLNMILAVANGHYSLRITNLLQEYEEKPLDSLPRIDPFNGQYRKPSQTGNQELIGTRSWWYLWLMLVHPDYWSVMMDLEFGYITCIQQVSQCASLAAYPIICMFFQTEMSIKLSTQLMSSSFFRI